ncbi:MAG: type II toxin-antitoxin system death-on-curing family toxin [Bacteriovoracia bacterium]
MRLIVRPTLEAVIEVNRQVCEDAGNPHSCIHPSKIESAISTAFYPGLYPFAHGGLARVAGALCYYIVMAHAFIDGNKRTGALTAITFLNMHGMDLSYPIDEEKDIDALADLIESCAASNLKIEDIKNWFETHKVYLDD